MKIAILGTGVVGMTLADGITRLGHDVVIGTRDVAAARARREPTPLGGPGFGAWAAEHPEVDVATMAEAAVDADLVINATSGEASIAALDAVGEDGLDGRVVIDAANPLDFSRGMPPTLSVVNDDSLGERLQRRFPSARIVKSLNTVAAAVMIDPGSLGEVHTMFVCGNDDEAKRATEALLRELGWSDVVDLGDITAARGMEMYLPLWLRMWGALGTHEFSIRVVRGE
ncbi:MAG: NAD(P)-binding domain-containing protein [Thermoleophilia bacterium]|nr:NAD(P)-binding domain-containing protein [Thermoleophilia bacterium]